MLILFLKTETDRKQTEEKQRIGNINLQNNTGLAVQ